jgi:hypothetical protein
MFLLITLFTVFLARSGHKVGKEKKNRKTGKDRPRT